LGDIDKLVNSKISQKGSQLIYELDVSSRELRVLRDNYRLMQTMMMEELRSKYCRSIQSKENKIAQLRERAQQQQELVARETLAAVEISFKELEDAAEKTANEADASVAIAGGARAPPSGLRGSQARGGVN